MSLPSPSTTHQSHPITNADDFAEFEQPLMELARRSKGDLRRLLTAFFGFLHRRTDFYCVTDGGGGSGEAALTSMGFRMGEAEKLLLASFRQFPLRKVGTTAAPPPPPQAGATARPQPAARGVDSKVQATETSSSATNEPSNASSSDEQKSSSVDEKASSTTKSISPTTSGSTTKHDTTKMAVDAEPTTATTTTTSAAASTMANIRWTEEGLQIPVGNGGSTERYQWTQTLEEVTVLVPVHGALRGKDLHVTIAPQSLLIRTKKAPLLPSLPGETKPTESPPTYEYVAGPLSAAIDPNESTWSLEGGVVQVILYKTVPTFWSHVIQGDAEIDTDLVDNRRNIHSYDDATQAKLRQVMFDQAQLAKGLPTSDQLLQKGKNGPLPVIPPLPPGVEYINQEVLDKASSLAAAAAGDSGKAAT
jgi:hypothetical protein